MFSLLHPWIPFPCEALPPAGEEVLVTIHCEGLDDETDRTVRSAVCTGPGFSVDGPTLPEGAQIVAFMPFPDAYQGT